MSAPPPHDRAQQQPAPFVSQPAPVAAGWQGAPSRREATRQRLVRLCTTPDRWWAVALGLLALALYLRTLAPSVATIFDDSLEFPLVAWRFAIAHPTGYPLYTLLAGVAVRLIPLGDVAYRVNLLSAVSAAGAVAGLFLAARWLGASRPAALWGSALLATAPTFWSQATIAEVYTLHLLLLVLLVGATLRWHGMAGANAQPPLLPLVLLGLGLTHHRMIALWGIALGVLVWWQLPSYRRPGRAWLPLIAACGLPLLLYLYLPLRGAVGSLDGSYQPTLSGFLCWVQACQYTSFLTANPLHQERDLLFGAHLLSAELGTLALGLSFVGLLAHLNAARTHMPTRRALLFLGLGAFLSVAFATLYRVDDIEVFWLPVLVPLLLWSALGLDALASCGAWLAGRWGRHRLTSYQAFLPAIALLLATTISLPRWAATYPTVDRSHQWQVYEVGLDQASQPLPPNATLIGILGEMTLVRYFQETHGLNSHVPTIAADTEAARLEAVAQVAAQGRVPVLTRPLPGVVERWSLSAMGPLIEVRAQPRTALPPSFSLPPGAGPFNVGAGIHLLGWHIAPRTTPLTPTHRLTVAWQPTVPLTESLKISPRLVLRDGTEYRGQDTIPVHYAYPTTAWRPGEIILDAYTLPQLPGPATVLLILYREADGTEVGRVELPLLPA